MAPSPWHGVVLFAIAGALAPTVTAHALDFEVSCSPLCNGIDKSIVCVPVTWRRAPLCVVLHFHRRPLVCRSSGATRACTARARSTARYLCHWHMFLIMFRRPHQSASRDKSCSPTSKWVCWDSRDAPLKTRSFHAFCHPGDCTLRALNQYLCMEDGSLALSPSGTDSQRVPCFFHNVVDRL